MALVSAHAFKESVRDRVVSSIAVFAVVLVAASFLIGQITANQDLKIVKDLGLAAIELAGVAMAVFAGIGLVSKEIDRRSLYSLLAKPLPRWEFVLGKFFGLVLTIVVNVALMTAAFYALLAWIGWSSPDEVRRSWDAPAADPALLLGIVMILAELVVLTAVALFFSTFSSSASLSLVLTLGVWIAGIESDDLRHFGDLVASPATPFVISAGWIVPAFSAFDIKTGVAHGQIVPAAFLAWRLLYASIYSSAVVGAAALVFSRREFR